MEIRTNIDLAGCIQFQKELADFGIVTSIYNIHGKCLLAGSNCDCTPHSICSQCQYSQLWRGDDLDQAFLDSLKNSQDPNQILHHVPVDVSYQGDLYLFYCDGQSAKRSPVDRKLIHYLVSSFLKKQVAAQQQQKEIEILASILTQRYEELHLLHFMTSLMKFSQAPEPFFSAVCKELHNVLNAQAVYVFWQQQQEFKHLGFGTSFQGLDKCQDRIWSTLHQVALHPCGLLVDNRLENDLFPWPHDVDNVLLVPIRQDQHVKGGILAVNKNKQIGFNSVDAKLLTSTANEIATYLENNRLYQSLQQLFVGSLKALANSIDAKDPYTYGHSERVARLSSMVAEQLGLDQREREGIYLTGLLHDLGKIGVNESVLCKNGKLNDTEFAQIKKHPEMGQTILQGIEVMHDVIQGVVSHHERFDGRGYPHGLAGDDIPLAGRIIMLADSFDAMTSERPYQQARSFNDAREEIKRCRSTQFDPEVADAFLQIDRQALGNVAAMGLSDELPLITSNPFNA